MYCVWFSTSLVYGECRNILRTIIERLLERPAMLTYITRRYWVLAVILQESTKQVFEMVDVGHDQHRRLEKVYF